MFILGIMHGAERSILPTLLAIASRMAAVCLLLFCDESMAKWATKPNYTAEWEMHQSLLYSFGILIRRGNEQRRIQILYAGHHNAFRGYLCYRPRTDGMANASCTG